MTWVSKSKQSLKDKGVYFTCINRIKIEKKYYLGAIHKPLMDGHPLNVSYIKLICFSPEFNETWWSCSKY